MELPIKLPLRVLRGPGRDRVDPEPYCPGSDVALYRRHSER